MEVSYSKKGDSVEGKISTILETQFEIFMLK